MLAERRLNPALTGPQLDDYLSRGWFRMNQSLFVTHFLRFGHRFFSAVWLRIDLERYRPLSRWQHPGYLASRFRVAEGAWQYTEEQELLYGAYRDSLPFDVAATLRELLMGQADQNLFDTRQVAVYDGQRLVALGIYDMGHESAAGITSMYHPDYRRISPGKAVMAYKMDLCRQRGVRFFYPGYIAPGYPRFDYKTTLAPGATEWLDAVSNQWQPLIDPGLVYLPLDDIKHKLLDLMERLRQSGIWSALMYYGQFDASLVLPEPGLNFGYPLFLFLQAELSPLRYRLVVFDIQARQYRMLQAWVVLQQGTDATASYPVCFDLLNLASVDYVTDDAEAMVMWLHTHVTP